MVSILTESLHLKISFSNEFQEYIKGFQKCIPIIIIYLFSTTQRQVNDLKS